MFYNTITYIREMNRVVGFVVYMRKHDIPAIKCA